MEKIPFTKRKIFRFRLWKVLVVMLLAAFVIAALEYFRFQGLANTLIKLVDQETNGEYELVIEKSEIDFVNLSMKLVNADIRKTSTVKSGLDVIEIPEIYIEFGSLVSLLNRKQVVIQDFHVTEPMASLYLTEADQQEPEKPLNIAHEVGQIVPFVEGVLKEFDIISFKINRSKVNLQKQDNLIKIGLITLLIDRWNMRDLSDEASIRLELWKQEIPINRSRIAFDSITYDYQDRLLAFRNFQMWQYDTAGRETLHLKEADLFIHQLDWDALVNDERYVLEEIRIESARISASIYSDQPTISQEPRPRHPLANFLKQNLGDLKVRYGGIFDAHIDLMMYLPQDSVALSLPQITMEFEAFMVNPDSSTIMFDNVGMALRDAEIILDNDMSLKFKRLHYQDGENLRIDSIELKHASSEYDVIQCESLALYNFSIFNYLYEKSLIADSAVLSNGNIVFREPPSEIRPRRTTVKRGKKPIAMDIGKLIFREMDILYNYDRQRFHAAGINGVMANYKRSGSESDYELRYFTSSKVRFTDSREAIDASIHGFNFRPRQLKLASLAGYYKELNFELTNLVASPENFNIRKPFYYAWNSLNLGKLNLSGALPPPSGDAKEKSDGPAIRVSSLAVNQLDIDLTGDEQRYEVSGQDIRFSRVAYAEGNLDLPQASARLDNIGFKNKDLELRIANALINNRRRSSIDGIVISRDNMRVELSQLEMGPWEYQHEGITLGHATLKDLSLIQGDRLSHVDSIGMGQFNLPFGGDPALDKLTIYKPNLNFKTGGSSSNDSSAAPRPLKWVKEILITPGKLQINDQHVSFGQIDLVRQPAHLQAEINNIAYQTSSNSLQLKQLKTDGDDILLTWFELDPMPGYEASMELENDVFEGEFHQLTLKEVDWTRLIEDHELYAEELKVDGFNMEIRRNKQLPDPPAIRKPFLFSQLIPQVDGVEIPVIDVTDGNITYKEISDKTGKQGVVTVNDINGKVRLEKELNETENVLLASARFYDSALFTVNYNRLDSTKFSLQVDVENLAAPLLNQMVDSLEAVKLKSGLISEFSMSIEGTEDLATGRTLISYEDLNVEIFKKGSPEQTNIGSGLLTLLADGIILKHSKYDAIGQVKQERIHEKGPINYWVKSLIHGALSAVRTGKSQKRPKEKKKRRSR